MPIQVNWALQKKWQNFAFLSTPRSPVSVSRNLYFLQISYSIEAAWLGCRVVLKFDRRRRSNAAEPPVNFQIDPTIPDIDPETSRFHETIYEFLDIETEPALFQRRKKCLFSKSREISKAQDQHLKLSDRPQIWQATLHHCCGDARQILERSDYFDVQSRRFEVSRDLEKIWFFFFFRYWNRALVALGKVSFNKWFPKPPTALGMKSLKTKSMLYHHVNGLMWSSLLTQRSGNKWSLKLDSELLFAQLPFSLLCVMTFTVYWLLLP